MSDASPVTAVPRPPASSAPAPVAADLPGPGPDALERLLAPLDGLEQRPVAEHPAAYEQVHAGLRAVLAGEPTRD